MSKILSLNVIIRLFLCCPKYLQMLLLTYKLNFDELNNLLLKNIIIRFLFEKFEFFSNIKTNLIEFC